MKGTGNLITVDDKTIVNSMEKVFKEELEDMEKDLEFLYKKYDVPNSRLLADKVSAGIYMGEEILRDLEDMEYFEENIEKLRAYLRDLNMKKIWWNGDPMKVVITRPAEKGKDFSKLLEKNGFETIILPTLELVFKKAQINLEKYSWIVFTSPRGVEGFFRNLDLEDAKKVLTKKIGAIGTETAKEFERTFGKSVDVIPKQYTAENLLEALQKQIQNGEKVLVPTTPSTRDVLKEGLNADLIFVYSSEKPANIPEKLTELEKLVISENSQDRKVILTFTSGLTAKNFFKHCNPEFLEILKEQYIVSIGPITKKNVDSFGFDSLMPEKNYTVEAMVPVIKDLNIWFSIL